MAQNTKVIVVQFPDGESLPATVAIAGASKSNSKLSSGALSTFTSVKSNSKMAGGLSVFDAVKPISGAAKSNSKMSGELAIFDTIVPIGGAIKSNSKMASGALEAVLETKVYIGGAIKSNSKTALDYFDIAEPGKIRIRGAIKSESRMSGELAIGNEPAAPYFPDFQLRVGVYVPVDADKSIQFTQPGLLKIDGVEVEAKEVVMNADPVGIGQTINVTLFDASQRNLINDDSHVELFVAGDKIFDSNSIENSSWSISPTDSGFSFSARDTSSKLLKIPETEAILYDFNRLNINSSELPKVYGSDGKSYKASLVGIGGLSLHRVLKYVAQKCGYLGFKTDIKNYLIPRIDFTFKQRYLETIGGSIGQYRPLVYERGGYLHIDPKVRPAAVSTLAPLNADLIETLGAERQHVRPDFFVVNYQVNELEFSNYKVRYEQQRHTDANGNEIRIQETWRDYYHVDPNQITDSKIEFRLTSTFNPDFEQIGELRETIQYDLFGRETNVEKSLHALVPNLNNSRILELLEVAAETTTTEYAVNPFSPSTQYVKRISHTKSGTVTIDSENPYLDQPFKQAIGDAHGAGNIADGQSTSDQITFSENKYFTPMANGQMACLRVVIDNVRNTTPIVESTISQGNGSINSARSISKQFYLFYNDARNGNPPMEIYTGELPFAEAKRISEIDADRIASGRNRQFRVTMFSYDKTLVQGAERALYDDNGVFVANVIIAGFTINIDSESVRTELLVEEF